MCCGVAQNTYHTISDLRMVLHDGTILDTHDEVSWKTFQITHGSLVRGITALAERVKADKELAALITKKFSIKCTTGYSINALVDFTDPKEVWAAHSSFPLPRPLSTSHALMRTSAKSEPGHSHSFLRGSLMGTSPPRPVVFTLTHTTPPAWSKCPPTPPDPLSLLRSSST